jgi:phosphatidylethanolamine/phosphatidyl-N-methylethanolamine N-methyltransferase
MAHSTISRIYNFYGRFYDIFEIFFRHRLAKALAPIPFRPGDRVLDIGVGTGFSLRHYPKNVHVTGIDNSPQMLEAAQRKLRNGRRGKSGGNRGGNGGEGGGVQATTHLQSGDALHLPFADNAFDVVLLSHVISTVSDPQRCFAEALRVTREHGLLVLVNHFASTHPVMGWLERTFDPLCRRLGWRNDLSLATLLSRAGGCSDEMTPARRPGKESGGGAGVLFQIVYLRKTSDGPCIVRMPHPRPMPIQPRFDPI